MTDHAWTTEYVDAGVVDGTFWICPVCGASGGPVLTPREESRGIKRWAAFLAGTGIKVGEDCQKAQTQIRAYLIDERLAAMAKKWKAATGEHRWYASLIKDAITWSPEITDLTPILSLLLKIEQPVWNKGVRMPVMEVRDALETLGFNCTPRAKAGV